MTVYELKRLLSELQDANEWAAGNEVKLDVGTLVADIDGVEFDRDKGEFYIVACRR